MTKDYKISKAGAQCVACEAQLDAGAEVVAVLRERGDEFIREDHCVACWDKHDRGAEGGVFGVWRTHVPREEEKKKLLVDDDLLIDFFERLGDADEPAKINFRFVLALVLMRKKLLVYDRSETDESGRQVWTVHFRKSEQKHSVLDPKLDENKIAEVSQSLSQIMRAGL